MFLEEKLKLFMDVTTENAGRQSSMEVNEYKKMLSNSFEEYKKSSEDRAYTQYTIGVEAYSREASAKAAKHIAKKRKEYTDKQLEIKEDVINEVRSMILDFKKSEGYFGYLEKCIKKAVDIAEGTKFTVYIDPSDEHYLSSLKKSDYNIIVSENEFIGGIIAEIPEKNIFLDDTFLTKLKEEEQKIIF